MEPITLTIPVELVMVAAILVAFVVVSPLILHMTARLKPLPRMAISLAGTITVALLAITCVGLAWGVWIWNFPKPF